MCPKRPKPSTSPRTSLLGWISPCAGNAVRFISLQKDWHKDIQRCGILFKWLKVSLPAVPHKVGGSFKDRKPIGEVGCCDSWMAERTGQQAILRDFLQQWKVGSLVPERFAISSSPSLSSIARPRKRDARSYEVLPLSRKIIFMLKVQPVSGNWRPDL